MDCTWSAGGPSPAPLCPLVSCLYGLLPIYRTGWNLLSSRHFIIVLGDNNTLSCWGIWACLLAEILLCTKPGKLSCVTVFILGCSFALGLLPGSRVIKCGVSKWTRRRRRWRWRWRTYTHLLIVPLACMWLGLTHFGDSWPLVPQL